MNASVSFESQSGSETAAPDTVEEQCPRHTHTRGFQQLFHPCLDGMRRALAGVTGTSWWYLTSDEPVSGSARDHRPDEWREGSMCK
jgi:hypothetical protein